MLYGVRSIVELKSKLLAHERFKAAFKEKNHLSESKTNTSGSDSEKNFSGKSTEKFGDKKRCYLCGDTSHVQSSCPTKEKGVKCFKCNEYGHRGCDKVCPKYEEKIGSNRDKQEKMMSLSKEKSVKTVQLGGFGF